MSHAVRDCFLTRLRARIGAFAIIQSPRYFLIGLRGPLRVRALVLVRYREPGDHDDDANRDSNQDPSALDAHADFTAQITFNDKFGNSSRSVSICPSDSSLILTSSGYPLQPGWL